MNIDVPRALIGFSGPRVSKQTVGEILPPAFQLSELLASHQACALVVEPRNLRALIDSLTGKLCGQDGPTEAPAGYAA